MANVEIDYIVHDPANNVDDITAIVRAMVESRKIPGDAVDMHIGEKMTTITMSRLVTNTGNHAEVMEEGESMRRGLEATFASEEREKLARRFAGGAIRAANEELAVE